MNSRSIIILLAVLLGLFVILAGFWGFKANQLSKENTSLSEEKSGLEEELGGLEEVRDQLQSEVDSLEQAYFSVAQENEELQGSLAAAQNEIVSKNVAIKNAKRANSNEINNLKAEIQELITAKQSLENSILAVQAENDSLLNLTGMLQKDLATSKEENEPLNNLNQSIQEEVDRLTLANFKASGFQIETEQKNAKVTSKSKRIRRIKVSFDLTNVPDKYQGVKPLYLAITDSKGTPINAENPVSTTISVNGSSMDLIAVEGKEVNIEETQRLSFTHELADKLPSGFYRAAIYTDIGFLGATSFKLR